MTFTAAHWSGFATGGNVNLSFDNNGPKNTTEILTFSANYINATSGAHIVGAECNLSLYNNSVFTMVEVGSASYDFNITHSVEGDHDYNISCSKSVLTTLVDVDQFTISDSPLSSIPEFSDYAMMLIMVIAIGGFLVVRKKDLNS